MAIFRLISPQFCRFLYIICFSSMLALWLYLLKKKEEKKKIDRHCWCLECPVLRYTVQILSRNAAFGYQLMQFLRRIRNIFFVSNTTNVVKSNLLSGEGGPWDRAPIMSSYCAAYRLHPALQTITISKVQDIQNSYDQHFRNFPFSLQWLYPLKAWGWVEFSYAVPADICCSGLSCVAKLYQFHKHSTEAM